MPPETTSKSRKPRTTERMVQFLFATCRSLELRPDGTVGEFFRTARPGQVVTLDLVEASGLDALGALGPPGCTIADVEADLVASYAVYQASRRGVCGGALMGVVICTWDRKGNIRYPGQPGAEVRARGGTPFTVTATAGQATQQAAEDEPYARFTAQHFPEIEAAAAGKKYAIGGGVLGVSRRSQIRSAAPPTPANGLPSAPPPAYVGPARPPATPSMSVSHWPPRRHRPTQNGARGASAAARSNQIWARSIFL